MLKCHMDYWQREYIELASNTKTASSFMRTSCAVYLNLKMIVDMIFIDVCTFKQAMLGKSVSYLSF